jgi:tetratricopeptide (TPR) repeat protein
VWDDSHIQYPMRFTASHGFREVEPWPVEADGTDLSIVKNQTKGPVSLFVHGSREPFMGVWHPHTNTGTVHYADYAQLPAKKIWSWGTDPDGLDWRKTLSDNHSAYVEVQAGLFRNQETYAFLEPRQTISFSEFWMPVRDLGGISRANLAGVVHLRRQGDALLASLNVNQAIPGAQVRLLLGDREAFAEKLDLAPERTWQHELAKADAKEKYTFELRDGKGTTLLRQTEDRYDWTPVDQIHIGPQAAYHIPPPDRRTEDDWLQLGKEEELDGNPLGALQTYQVALTNYPDSFELHKSAGRLYAGLLRFQEAKDNLELVYARNTSDGEGAYYLGLAQDGLGENRDARASYEAAARLPAFRAPAELLLSELSAREGNLKEAESYLRFASEAAPDDLRTAEELSAVLRAEGQQQSSRKLAQQWLVRFPDSYFLLEEIGKPDLHHLANDTQRVLNVASEYMRLGMYTQALEVLTRDYPTESEDESEPGQLPPSKHPLVAYYAAYCQQKLHGSATFDKAAKLFTEYVFPSRAEDLEVLSAALKSNPQDASAHYLIGTLYFSKGLADQALAEWQQTRQLNAQIPVLHASLGRALLHVKEKPAEALDVFQEGLRTDGRNLELYRGIDQTLSILQKPAQERVAALQRYPDLDHMPTPLTYELILNLAEAGDFDKAEAMFHNRFFQREEGGTNVRQVWLEVDLQKALSLARHAHCPEAVNIADHIAQPVPDLLFTHDGLQPFLASARFNYLLGSTYKACNLSQKAQSHFTEAAQSSNLNEAIWSWKASQELPNTERSVARQKLEAALNRVRNDPASDSATGRWLYQAGMLDRELGNAQQANKEFRDALLQPDQMMTYHLTRLAMSENQP